MHRLCAKAKATANGKGKGEHSRRMKSRRAPRNPELVPEVDDRNDGEDGGGDSALESPATTKLGVFHSTTERSARSNDGEPESDGEELVVGLVSDKKT